MMCIEIFLRHYLMKFLRVHNDRMSNAQHYYYREYWQKWLLLRDLLLPNNLVLIITEREDCRNKRISERTWLADEPQHHRLPSRLSESCG